MDKVARIIVAIHLALMLAFLGAVWRVKGLFSAEMATWVQAFGAIIALAIAIGAPILQARRARADALAALSEIATHAATLVRVAAEQKTRARWRDGRLTSEADALQDAASSLQAVPLLQVPSGGAAKELIVLTRVVKAALLIVINGPSQDISEIAALTPLAEEAESCARAIARHAKFSLVSEH